MVFAIGPEIARGAGGGSIHAVVRDHAVVPSKVAKVMPARDIKEVLVQMYVNRLDPSLAPMIYSYGQVSRTKMMYVIMDKIDGTLETRMHSGSFGELQLCCLQCVLLFGILKLETWLRSAEGSRRCL